MNKTTKIFSAIIAAALLTGCAADKAVSSDVGETTQTTTVSEPVQTTTTAATTNATTSAATETTVTEPEELPVTEPQQEEPSAPEQPTEPSTPSAPEQTTTPSKPTTSDGQYTLADSDLVNPDGTYTFDFGDPNLILPSCLDYEDIDPAFWASINEEANPSKIPYSQITVENAHLAFPYTGWIGTSQATLREDTGSVAETGPDMSPGYIEILPTDSRETIEWKIRANTIGTNDTQFDYGQEIEDNCLYDRPHHFFASEADYKEFLAESQRLKDDYDRRSENQDGKILGDLTEEEIEDIFNSRR